jgi:hypothetical protein
MKYVAFLSIVLIGSVANAQDKVFVVNPGQRVSDVVPKREIYAYPSFEQGAVYFADGSVSNALMNYNALYGEIQFINPKGDTLSLADEEKIKLLTINNDSFYFDHGFMQLLSNSGNIKLLRRNVIRQSSSSKIGLYDQSVDGGAASSYSSISSGAHDADLVLNQKATLTRQTFYLFGDGKGHLLSASRKSAEKLYPSKKAVIADYLSKNNIDFKNEADLKNMVAYLQSH